MFKAYGKMWVSALSIKGRATRGEYWLAWLFNAIIMSILCLIEYSLGLSFNKDSLSVGINLTAQGVLSLVYSLAIAIPMLTLTIRRLHDRNKSGYYYLLTLIPIVGWFIIFIQLVSKPVNKNNRFKEETKKMKVSTLIFLLIIYILVISLTFSLITLYEKDKLYNEENIPNRDSFYTATNLVRNHYLKEIPDEEKQKVLSNLDKKKVKNIENVYKYVFLDQAIFMYNIDEIEELKKESGAAKEYPIYYVEMKNGIVKPLKNGKDVTIKEYLPYPDTILVISENNQNNVQYLISSDRNLYFVNFKTDVDEFDDEEVESSDEETFNLKELYKSLFDKSYDDLIEIKELKYQRASIVVREAFANDGFLFVIDENMNLYRIYYNDIGKVGKIKNYVINVNDVIINYVNGSKQIFKDEDDEGDFYYSTLSLRNHNIIDESDFEISDDE